jgi:hypothetical protein
VRPLTFSDYHLLASEPSDPSAGLRQHRKFIFDRRVVSHMAHVSGRYGDLDYPKIAKYGFLAGVALFLGGALGELALTTALVDQAPAWLTTVLFDIEVIGLLVGFFAPLLFGLVLPLTE